MENLPANNPATSPEQKESEPLFRFTLLPPSCEVRGFNAQDTLALLKKPWWLYLLMLFSLAIIAVAVFYLKEGAALLFTGAVSKFFAKKITELSFLSSTRDGS